MTITGHRVVVTVGTDHHRFDRLITWVEDLVPEIVSGDDVLVQHGASRASTLLVNQSFFPRAELLQQMSAADLVIGHGGPGTIMDARSVGRIPVIVPRLARLGEVVDNHQVAFCRRLGAQGLILSVENPEDFRNTVRSGLGHPSRLRLHGAETSRQTGEVIEYLRGIEGGLTRPRRAVLLNRLGGLVSRSFR